MSKILRWIIPSGLVLAAGMYIYHLFPATWFGSLAFIIGVTSGSMFTFSVLCAIILIISGYEHKAEKDRVIELNRNCGQINRLQGEGMQLYFLRAPDEEWERHQEEWNAETKRHRQTDGAIMERHGRSELVRFLIFAGLFLFLCVASIALLLAGAT